MWDEQVQSAELPAVSAEPAEPRIWGACNAGALRKSAGATYAFERPHRPLLVRLFNGCGRLLRRRGWRRPLSAERILAVARRRAGLDDFGDLDVREPLARLVESLEGENRLAPLGRTLIHQEFVSLAEARLGVVAALKEHPEVLREEVHRPVFVLGLPRTGTTLLHRLLAQDPETRVLHLWETLRPGPGLDAYRERRVRQTRRDLAVLTGYMAPQMQAIHPMDAEDPEECRLLLMNTFRWNIFGAYGRHDGYNDWLEGQGAENTRRVYEDYRRQLQLLQWRRPPRRWVLKSPSHVYALDVLLRLFPDACIVQTHRDLHEVLPSLCSLRFTLRGLYSDAPDPRGVGAEVATNLVHRIRKAVRARAEHPGRVYDVAYRDLVRDPIAAVRGIYGHLDRPLTEAASEAMQTWLAANPQGKRGRHRYSLEQFGLDEGTIDRLRLEYPQDLGLLVGGRT
jgi:hypothetical protein